jgi:hypothetical protein
MKSKSVKQRLLIISTIILLFSVSCNNLNANDVIRKLKNMENSVKYSYIQSELFDYMLFYGKYPESLDSFISEYHEKAEQEYIRNLLIDPFSKESQLYIYLVSRNRDSCALISRGVDGTSPFELAEMSNWFDLSNNQTNTDPLLKEIDTTVTLDNLKFDILLFELEKRTSLIANSYIYEVPQEYFRNTIKDTLVFNKIRTILFCLNDSLDYSYDISENKLRIKFQANTYIFDLLDTISADDLQDMYICATYDFAKDGTIFYKLAYTGKCNKLTSVRSYYWSTRKLNSFKIKVKDGKNTDK